MFIATINPPAIVSLTGLVLALSSCYLSMQHSYVPAVICFMYAGIADLFDGPVARKCTLSEQEQKLGVHIDSLIDAISFGAVPVIMLLHMGYHGLLFYIIFSGYCCCAVLRLAYFNVMKNDDHTLNYYTGLPTTYSALILPLMLVALPLVTRSFQKYLVMTVIAVMSVLFVLNIRIPKPRGIFYIVFPLIAVVLTLYLLLGNGAVVTIQ